MHVGLVTATYLPVNNGVTRMVSLYKKYLEEAGHRATIFTLGERNQINLDKGIVRSRGVKLADTGYYFTLRYSGQAQSLLARVDIIHCHHLLMGLEFAHRYGRSPIVYTNHTRFDLYAQTYLKLPRIISRTVLRRIWRRLMAYSDVTLVPSQSSKRLINSFDADMDIQVIENGIELEHFSQMQGSFRRGDLGLAQEGVWMIYVGRLAEEKNLKKLLSEFDLAVQQEDGLKLLLVGSGPQKQELRQVIRKRKLDQKVKFAGEVPNHKVPIYLSVADIFVTASLSEIAPLTLIEAMAAGLPIAAIDAPGVTDLVVPGKAGILANLDNGDLAGAMLSLARNPVVRSEYGSSAHRISQRYHISDTVEKTVKLYRKLISGKSDGINLIGPNLPAHTTNRNRIEISH